MVTEKHEWIEAALTRYERPLVSYTQRITGDLERARDVVQDAFTRLCAQEPGKLDGRLAPWLYTVCRNRALDVVKKDGRMALLEDRKAEAYPSNGIGPRAAASRQETRSIIHETVATLPEDQQEAFRLKFQDDLTYREIGQVMGKSLGTVSTLISSALNTLRQKLGTTLDTAQEA